MERTLNAFQLLISCDSTTDGIIHVQGGQKPGLWGTGKTKRLWASVRRFRPWAESKVIGQERPIIGQDWKQSLVARFATFPGAKWPIFTRIVAIGQNGPDRSVVVLDPVPSAGESLDLPLAGLCGVSLFHALEESQLQQSPSPSQSRPVFSETLPIGSVFSRRQALPAPGGSPPLSPGLLDLGLFRTERLRASRTSDFRIICRSFCRIKCRGFFRVICHRTLVGSSPALAVGRGPPGV